jgi:ribosomal protein L22
MEVRAVAKYIRISPQKVRLVADLVRGKKRKHPAFYPEICFRDHRKGFKVRHRECQTESEYR